MAVAAKFPPAGLVGTRRAAAKPMATDITDEDNDDSPLAEPCMTPERGDGSIDWQTKIVVGLHVVALVGWAIYLVVAL